jgi:hypothetical protein
MDDEQRNVEMGRLVADVYELAGVLRSDGEQIAKLAAKASNASPTRSSPSTSRAFNPTPITNARRC